MNAEPDSRAGPLGRLLRAVVVFLFVSLAVAALRSDDGCEVMSLPGLLFGRRTRLACLVSSPIDRIERRLAGRSGGHDPCLSS